MFKVTNKEPRSMFLKSWSVLGINTKDKTIQRPWLNSDTNSLVATQDMILSWERFQVKEWDHSPWSRIYPRLWRGTSKRWLFYIRMSLWYVVHLTTYLDLKSCKILRSGFDFKSNLTSAIGDLANCGFLASYVSRHKAMAYNTCPHEWSCQTW